MTESEAFELFILIGDQQNQLMFGYFSLITAFLVMSHLVAEKLDLFLAYVTVLLFSLCCLWFITSLFGYYTDIELLYVDMLEKKANGIYELDWFGENPDWLGLTVSSLQLVLTFGGWVMSIAYFSYRRRAPRARD